jgi:hypothetical protein
MGDMPACNRVTPLGQIVSIDQRGLLMGNRGSIHREGSIVRQWQVRRWIACALEYKDWVAPVWQPNRWTPLFFWDEAVALAAGHRPCALCRRPDFTRWMDSWQSATGRRPTVDPMDRQLHAERTTADRGQRRHEMPWTTLPQGSFVVLDDGPALVLADRLVPWSARPHGYGAAIARPASGRALVLTPPSTVAVLRHGYVPMLHPTATSPRSASH